MPRVKTPGHRGDKHDLGRSLQLKGDGDITVLFPYRRQKEDTAEMEKERERGVG